MRSKSLLTVLSITLAVSNLGAQVPERFTYQAVVRNSGNELIKNTTVKVKIGIGTYIFAGIPPTLVFSPVYEETHQPVTNENGLFTVQVGAGTVLTGQFSSLQWGSKIYYIKTDIDPEGGNNYTISSISQILSVPYALHSKRAENGIIAYGNVSSDGTINSGSGNFTVTKSPMLPSFFTITLNIDPALTAGNLIVSFTPVKPASDPNLTPVVYDYRLSGNQISVLFTKFDGTAVTTGFSFMIINPY